MMLLKRISSALHVPEDFVKHIATSATYRYRSFLIQKRSGGQRVIHAPSVELKAIQRWLARAVVSKLPVHGSATAYQANTSIVKNASAHKSNKYFVRIDFRNFFGSLTADDVRSHLEHHLPRSFKESWTNDDRELFVQLVSRRRRLVIGAPTSPGLSNSLCLELDRSCAALASKLGATYTRYADDLVFSCNLPDVLWDVPDQVGCLLDGLSYPRLKINKNKTAHTSPKRRRVVTGLVITPSGNVSVGRETKRHIRTMLFSMHTLTAKQRAQLSGLLGYMVDVEPDYVNNLIIKYGREHVNAAIHLRQPPPVSPSHSQNLPMQRFLLVFDSSLSMVVATRENDRGRWGIPSLPQGSVAPLPGSLCRIGAFDVNVLGTAGSRVSHYPGFSRESEYIACQVIPGVAFDSRLTRWFSLDGIINERLLSYPDREVLRVNAPDAVIRFGPAVAAAGEVI